MKEKTISKADICLFLADIGGRIDGISSVLEAHEKVYGKIYQLENLSEAIKTIKSKIDKKIKEIC